MSVHYLEMLQDFIWMMEAILVRMSSARCRFCFLLWIMLAVDISTGMDLGVNIGTDISNFPLESDIISILKAQNIRHVRLFDADHKILNALADTGIEVIIGIPNDQLLQIGQSKAVAANWVKENVATFIPATNITYIAVGSEVLTSVPNAIANLVPAMQFLHSALVASNLNFQVKVSTPHSMGVIPKAFPPSTASFNSTWNSVLYQVLQFLKNTGSPFMLNALPYYGYMQGNGIFPLDYALFRPLAPNKQIVDPNTDSQYSNMFDSMIDAAYYAMQALNFSGIPILVTETGWPSHGGPDEPAATVENAVTYTNNLIRHVLNGSGTPILSNSLIGVYIYELFSEDLRSGRTSEKSYGLFFPNGTTAYSLRFSNVAELNSSSSGVGVFCVANSSAGESALKAGLDWACGTGGANCNPIQQGQACYDSSIVAVASYAYNDYYHRSLSSGGTCSFANTAYVTTTNPSHGSCIFAGSPGHGTVNGTILPATALSPISPGSGGSKVSEISVTIRLISLLWLLFYVLIGK